jgi:uncharacterized damage-inducible protein DinB
MPPSAIRHLDKLIAHMEWADRVVLEGLRSAPGSDPQALEYLAHVIGAEHIWISRIRGDPARHAVWPALTLDECADLAATNVRQLRELIGSMSVGDLDRRLAYTNSAGRSFESDLEDILLHIVLHGAYHRGQVSLMTRRSGGVPAPSDYIAFVRGVPTATRDDAARLVRSSS